MMNGSERESLLEQYERETGERALTPDGKFTIDFIEWLAGTDR